MKNKFVSYIKKNKNIFLTVLITIAIIILIETIGVVIYKKINNSIVNNVGVIVRSTGERTEKECIRRLQKLFGRKNVYLIKNAYPLANASAQTFNLSKQINKKWILVVDADVILFDDKIINFIEKAQQVIKKDKTAFSFQGMLFDNLMLRNRYVGFILYYKDNLKFDSNYFSRCSVSLRPDTCVRNLIYDEGYTSYQFNDEKIGIHGFFQYHEDLVKEGIMYAKKHDLILEKSEWEKLKYKHDYRYLLEGVEIYNSLLNKDIIPDDNYLNNLLMKYNIRERNVDEKLLRKQINEAVSTYNNSGEFSDKL